MEQVPRHHDLRHLETDVPGMRDDLVANLRQILPLALRPSEIIIYLGNAGFQALSAAFTRSGVNGMW